MSFIHGSFLGAIVVLGLACGPDTGGLSSSSEGSGSGSTGSEGSTSTSDSTTTSTSVATSDADGTTTTATSGPMDTTAEGSSGEPPGTDSSSSGEPPPPSYPACDPEGDPCPEPYETCVAPGGGGGGGGGIGSWCTLGCMDEGDCPVPDSGDATVVCGGPPMQPPRCELDCSMGDCPDGMECVGLGPMGQIQRCVWPPA